MILPDGFGDGYGYGDGHGYGCGCGQLLGHGYSDGCGEGDGFVFGNACGIEHSSGNGYGWSCYPYNLIIKTLNFKES